MTDILARLAAAWYRLIDWLNKETDYVYDWDLVHESVAEEHSMEDISEEYDLEDVD